MTENKAVETIEYIKTFDGMNFGATTIALDMAIQALQTVSKYQELEQKLQSVYGEHGELLEIVVNGLIKYEEKAQQEQGPFEIEEKSRLLIDDSADQWEVYKSMGTPAEISEKLYRLSEFNELADLTNRLFYESSLTTPGGPSYMDLLDVANKLVVLSNPQEYIAETEKTDERE